MASLALICRTPSLPPPFVRAASVSNATIESASPASSHAVSVRPRSDERAVAQLRLVRRRRRQGGLRDERRGEQERGKTVQDQSHGETSSESMFTARP
jgi:hypothetical protein